MVHDTHTGAERLLRVGEGLQRGMMREIATHVPAHDEPREQIGDEEQVRKRAVVEAEVGDVTDDDLAGAGHGHRFQVVRGDRVVMLRIRGLGRAALPRH